MLRVVAAVLDEAVLPADTEAALLERADGNPLYAEEFARMLRDRGLVTGRADAPASVSDVEIAVPETIQATITARLDALAPDRKRLLHDAAVIGKVFWAGSLASIGHVPKEAVLEGLHELARDLATRAAAFLGKAGRRAVVRGDRRGAANLLERARALLPAGDRNRIELALPLSHRLFESGDDERCQQLLAQALDEAVQVGDERIEMHLRVRRAWMQSWWAPEGFVQEADEIATRALRVFEQAGDELGQARAWALAAKRLRTLGYAGNVKEAWERALDHARRAGDRAAERETLHWLALTLYWGRIPAEEATSRLQEILREAEGDRELEARIKRILAGFRGMQGCFDEARGLLSEANTIFEELGMRRAAVTISFISGPIEIWAGNPDVAESALRESCEALQTVGERGALPYLAGFLAEALYVQGRLAESEHWTAVSARTAATDDLDVQADWRCVQAKLLARRGRFEEAEAMGREALEIVDRTGESDHKGDAYLDFAEICRLAGKTADEEEALRQAIAWYDAKGNLVMAGKARMLLAELGRQPSSARA